MNKSIFTCVELLNRENETHLKLAGVEEIIVGDEYAGTIMAATAKNHGIMSVVDELFTSKYGHQFFKIPITSTWIGKTALELFIWLKENHNALLLSVEQRQGNSLIHLEVNPDCSYRFQESDQIIVIANKNIIL